MLKDVWDLYDLTNYDFELPQELIASYPVSPRDSSRLLVVNKENGQVEDRVFTDIISFLSKGDTLVLNETKVMPARLLGYKDTGAKVELLLLKKENLYWETIVRPAKRLKKGAIVKFDHSSIYLEIIKELDIAGGRLVKFHNLSDEDNFINQIGQMPLPPYINREADISDKTSYQTVYAKELGSAAAPTAGLHFTNDLLTDIIAKGVNVVTVVLHVGLGTFRPVNVPDIRGHTMHKESYYLAADVADILNETRLRGNKIIAVGTTVVRTLETIFNNYNKFVATSGETDIFIYPGYQFKAVDSLITNFHLPLSSLLMLVAAFAGHTHTMNAYRHAINDKYRFFSYGDAMFLK